MQLSILTQAVTVTGWDIFGRAAWIRFSPHRSLGWHWAYRPNCEPIPITKELVSNRLKRICLNYQGARLEVFEHIGSLFFTGLTGIVIESSTYPPYHGRPLELWSALKPYIIPFGKKTEWLTLQRPVRAGYDNGRKGYVEFLPHSRPQLDLTVIIDFPKLGCRECHYVLPTTAALEEIYNARTLPTITALPMYLLMKAAHKLTLWPHHGHVVWPQEMDKNDLLEQIARHRAGDLLGALSLLNHRSGVAGNLVSYCAGHEADVKMIRQAQWEQM